MKPIVLYDKSFIQSLNAIETKLFGCLFSVNITPLLLFEIQADLTKLSTKSTSDIAKKVCELNSHLNIDHRILCVSELCGNPVPMEYKTVACYQGKNFEDIEGKPSFIYDRPDAIDKLARWSAEEFSDQDSKDATEWWNYINKMPQKIKQLYETKEAKQKFSSLEAIRQYAENLIYEVYRDRHRGALLRYVFDRFGITDDHKKNIIQRWKSSGGLALVEFAPYTAYVILIELFFEVAVAAGFISAIRQSNRIDMAYLYYLPFTQIFISGDKLHEKTVPLFVAKEYQLFITQKDIRTDLKKLVTYYSADGLGIQELIKTVQYPPLTGDFLTSKIYDRFCNRWHEHAANPIQIIPRLKQYIIKLMKKWKMLNITNLPYQKK